MNSKVLNFNLIKFVNNIRQLNPRMSQKISRLCKRIDSILTIDLVMVVDRLHETNYLLK